MIEEGTPYEKGLVLDYWACDPRQLIVKIQGTLEDNFISLKVVVNAAQGGEIYLEDDAYLDDGDRIYAEPDGLTVLRSGATVDQIEKIGEQIVQIGSFFDGTFLTHPTVEP